MNVAGEFVHGMDITGTRYTHFELREALTADMLDAELDAGVSTPLNFNAQMMVRQLVKVSSASGEEFNGPFVVAMIKGLKPVDYREIRTKQMELDSLGEGS